MLRLGWLTPPEWAAQALADPDRLLLDHMFCEEKAAARPLAFVKRYGGRFPKVVEPLLSLAKEEMEHFEACGRLLRERGAPPMPHHGNPYVAELRRRVNRDGGGSELDQLMLSAFIEARSAERFRLLADALRGSTMGRFYEDLFAAEARHHALFVDLAADVFGSRAASRRVRAVAAIEADIAQSRPWGSFLH